MANKNLNLIFLIFLMAMIFTGVIYIPFKFNLLIGSLATFLLIVTLTVGLLKEMIEQKYDLLSDLPAQGQTVNPIQLIAFGKIIIWQYPSEGPFIFDFVKGLEKEPRVTSSDVLSSSLNTLSFR